MISSQENQMKNKRETIIWKWIWCLGSELIAPCEKIRLLDINHRALIHFPQYQMPIRPVTFCQPMQFAWPRCIQIFANITTRPISTCDVTEDLFWSGHLFGPSFFQVHTPFNRYILIFNRLEISICQNPFFCSRDELDAKVNSPIDGSRSAEFALEIFELVKSRHLLFYVTIIPFFNFA